MAPLRPADRVLSGGVSEAVLGRSGAAARRGAAAPSRPAAKALSHCCEWPSGIREARMRQRAAVPRTLPGIN